MYIKEKKRSSLDHDSQILHGTYRNKGLRPDWFRVGAEALELVIGFWSMKVDELDLIQMRDVR